MCYFIIDSYCYYTLYFFLCCLKVVLSFSATNILINAIYVFAFYQILSNIHCVKVNTVDKSHSSWSFSSKVSQHGLN